MQLGKAVAAGVAPDDAVATENTDVKPAEVTAVALDNAVPETVGSSAAK